MQAKAQEVQRCQAADTANQRKWEKRDHGRHRIRQNFLEENMTVPQSQHLRGLNISHAAQFEKFCTHVVAERNPVERSHNQNQKPEAATIDASNQNHHIEHRERRPNFNEALHAGIPELAEIPLNAANDDSEKCPQHRQKQAKADADAEPMNQSSKHIAAIAVGAQPVPCTRRKRRSSLFVQVRLQGVMGNRRHQRPNIRTATSAGEPFGGIFFAFLNRRKELAVILLRLVFPAKILFAVAHKRRKIVFAFVTQEKRFVIYRPWTCKRKQICHDKHQKRPESPFILTEASKSFQGFLCLEKLH